MHCSLSSIQYYFALPEQCMLADNENNLKAITYFGSNRETLFEENRRLLKKSDRLQFLFPKVGVIPTIGLRTIQKTSAILEHCIFTKLYKLLNPF